MEDDNNIPTPAAAPGCTAAATHVKNFMTTSMEQESESDWDSEPDKPTPNFHPVGMRIGQTMTSTWETTELVPMSLPPLNMVVLKELVAQSRLLQL